MLEMIQAEEALDKHSKFHWQTVALVTFNALTHKTPFTQRTSWRSSAELVTRFDYRPSTHTREHSCCVVGTLTVEGGPPLSPLSRTL